MTGTNLRNGRSNFANEYVKINTFPYAFRLPSIDRELFTVAMADVIRMDMRGHDRGGGSDCPHKVQTVAEASAKE